MNLDGLNSTQTQEPLEQPQRDHENAQNMHKEGMNAIKEKEKLEKSSEENLENLKSGINNVKAQTESTHSQVQNTLNPTQETQKNPEKEVNIEDKNALAEKGLLALIKELEEKIAGVKKPEIKANGEKVYKIQSLPKAEMLTWLTDYVSKIEKYNELHRQNHPESKLVKTPNSVPTITFELTVEKTDTEIRTIQTENLKKAQENTPFYLFWQKPKSIQDLPDHLQEVPDSESFTLNIFNSNGQFYLETKSPYGKQLLSESNYHDSTAAIEMSAENTDQETQGKLDKTNETPQTNPTQTTKNPQERTKETTVDQEQKAA